MQHQEDKPNEEKPGFSIRGTLKNLAAAAAVSRQKTAATLPQAGVSIISAGPTTSGGSVFQGKSLDGAFEVIFRYNIPAGAAAYDLDFQFAPAGCSGLSTYDPSSFPDTIDMLEGDEFNGAARLLYGLGFGECAAVTVTVIVTDNNGEPFTDQVSVSATA